MTWLCVEQPSWSAHREGDRVQVFSIAGVVAAVVTGANPIDLRVETTAAVDPFLAWYVVPSAPAIAPKTPAIVPPASAIVPQFDLFGS